MNYINKSITLSMLAVGLLLTSCDNKLNIEPVNTIGSGQALETSADVAALLVGAYDSMGDEDVYGGNLQRDAELLGDNGELTWDGTYVEPGEIFSKKILTNNQQVEETWLDAYRTINICNTVLANLEKVTEANRNRIEGEAKFIRGTMYFELVSTFAKDWNNGTPTANAGVPLILTPTEVLDESNNVARNTVAEVYAQVLQDLTDAEAKLPATNSFFATKGAAAGMLSRVYLQQSKYPEAANAANRVIQSKAYELVPAGAVFDTRLFVSGQNTAETIFAMQVTDQDGTNSLNTFFAGADEGGRGEIIINDEHVALYEQGDARAQLFYIDAADLRRTSKFINQYGNIQVLRLAEMYLTRAEANFRSGTAVGAAPLADVNGIRQRSGLAPLTASQLTLDAILKERHLELAFEGQRLRDVKRTRQTVGGLPYNSAKLIYPIPQRETDVNANLTQNEGY